MELIRKRHFIQLRLLRVYSVSRVAIGLIIRLKVSRTHLLANQTITSVMRSLIREFFINNISNHYKLRCVLIEDN